MLEVLETIGSWSLAALGCLSLVVLAAAALYALDGLRRQKRYAAALLCVLVFAGALSTPGVWALTLACSAVVLTQAACYAYFAARTLLKARPQAGRASEPLPSVTLIVPAKDEGAVLEATLRSLNELDYPGELLEIVLIDDGSRDDTQAIVERCGQAFRHALRVVRHEISGGKARRLNEALHSLTSEFVLVLDADHCVKPDLIRRMLLGFERGAHVACVQVASAIRNADVNVLTKLLEMEYLFRCRGVYPGKRVGMFFGSGGMFRRAALLEVGGFDTSMLTEDVEISYRLYKHGKIVVYDDSVSSYDLAPLDFKNFFNQRHRWMRGLWQAMLCHLRETQARGFSAKIRAYFVQFTLDGFGALCLCVLEAYCFLGQLNLVAVRISFPIWLMLASCAFAFSVGCARGQRAANLIYLPLVPLYIVAHSLPMAWALVDSYLLGKPLVWVKTERVAAARSVDLSGESA